MSAGTLNLIWKGRPKRPYIWAVTVAQCFNTKICQAKEMGSSGWSWDGPRP